MYTRKNIVFDQPKHRIECPNEKHLGWNFVCPLSIPNTPKKQDLHVFLSKLLQGILSTLVKTGRTTVTSKDSYTVHALAFMSTKPNHPCVTFGASPLGLATGG
jgi:hypothetical protein